MIPGIDNYYDLGSEIFRWRNAYLGGDIYLEYQKALKGKTSGALVKELIKMDWDNFVMLGGDGNPVVVRSTSNAKFLIDCGAKPYEGKLLFTRNGDINWTIFIDYNSNLVFQPTSRGDGFVIIQTYYGGAYRNRIVINPENDISFWNREGTELMELGGPINYIDMSAPTTINTTAGTAEKPHLRIYGQDVWLELECSTSTYDTNLLFSQGGFAHWKFYNNAGEFTIEPTSYGGDFYIKAWYDGSAVIRLFIDADGSSFLRASSGYNYVEVSQTYVWLNAVSLILNIQDGIIQSASADLYLRPKGGPGEVGDTYLQTSVHPDWYNRIIIDAEGTISLCDHDYGATAFQFDRVGTDSILYVGAPALATDLKIKTYYGAAWNDRIFIDANGSLDLCDIDGTLSFRIDADGNITQIGQDAPATNEVLTWDGSKWVAGAGGVTDHGALSGLGDDDHTQYYNQARGDARYLQLTGGTISGDLTVSGDDIYTNRYNSRSYDIQIRFQDGDWLRARNKANTVYRGVACYQVHVNGTTMLTSGREVYCNNVLGMSGDLYIKPPTNYVWILQDYWGDRHMYMSSSGHVRPNYDKYQDLGNTGVNRWDDGYADDWRNESKWLKLPRALDDLLNGFDILRDEKGSLIKDTEFNSGYTLLNFMTVPEYLRLNEKSQEFEESISLNRAVNFIIEAIKQFHVKYEAKIAELEQRISSLGG